MSELLEELDRRSAEIRFEVIDFSAGEIIRLHQDGELAIQPAFQRMFRWTQAQQSRFVESMLLGLPIPQIVLFQRDDGVLELIDGLQRISSLIRFVTARSPNGSPPDQDDETQLIDCDLLKSLNGKTFNELEHVLQFELKRKTLRAIVIRRTNDPGLRFEMFKRLNAGGSPAEAHEIRNASLRIIGKMGEEFLEFLGKCASHPSYEQATDTLSDQSKRRLGREELVLRFFALKNSIGTYRGNISDWLDEYSERVAKGGAEFDFTQEWLDFTRVFDVIWEKLGYEAFLKHKGNRATGGLAPAYFDAVSAGLIPLTGRLAATDAIEAKRILNLAIGHENDDFRENVGPGANAVPRLRKRIAQVFYIFNENLAN